MNEEQIIQAFYKAVNRYRKYCLAHRTNQIWDWKHESDIIQIWKRKEGYYIRELEIKTSLLDLKNDFKKAKHKHLSDKLNFFAYLFEEKFYIENKDKIKDLLKDHPHIGIFTVDVQHYPSFELEGFYSLEPYTSYKLKAYNNGKVLSKNNFVTDELLFDLLRNQRYKNQII